MNSQTMRSTVARSVAKYRAAKKLTQEQLAQAMTNLGFDTGRLTVQRIEAAKRDVSLEELIVLAAVLDVPPLLLILPLGDGVWFQVGDDTLHPEFVRKWFTGQGPFGRTGRNSPKSVFVHGDTALWRQNAYPLRAFERLDELTERVRVAFQALVSSLRHADAPLGDYGGGVIPIEDVFALAGAAPEFVVVQLEDALVALGEHVATMRARDLVVEDALLPEGWARQVERLGVDMEFDG